MTIHMKMLILDLALVVIIILGGVCAYFLDKAKRPM